MNLWGNIGAFLSPILCKWLAQTIEWEGLLLVSIIPIIMAIVLWLFVHSDRPLME
ncbi:hypothetical protein BMG_3795 [Priestia megaterium]|nr:hypothetical protein BMG_3795 [Priestia megaterium]